MTVGSPKNGASFDAEANFDENSPKTKCCERSSIKPNVAISQNAVDPPFPSTTSYPSGRLNKDVRPSRTRFTTFLTGFCRCDVPRIELPLADNAANASGRIFDGPQPKRPSTGFIVEGITMSALMG